MKQISTYLFLICFGFYTNAQCAMCRAVAESSQSGGSSIADGLNDGILYLMAFPYVLLLIALVSLYLRNKKTS